MGRPPRRVRPVPSRGRGLWTVEENAALDPGLSLIERAAARRRQPVEEFMATIPPRYGGTRKEIE